MTQGRTLKELEDNIKDAYQMMVLDDVPEKQHFKEVLVGAAKGIHEDY